MNNNTAAPESLLLPRGVDCGFEGGATGSVAGLRLNYYCSNKARLLGGPSRRSPLWTILELPSLHATQAHAVPIYVARY